MARVVIFGTRDFAQLAKFYLDHDSAHEVVAFSVNEAHMNAERTFEGLPVVPFERVAETYPPCDFSFFAPMAPRGMNRLRAEVYRRIRALQYETISYVSSKATVFPGVTIGGNAFILENNTIQPFVSIGNNAVLWSGNHIGHHSSVGDHVSFTSHVVLSGHCVVEPFSFFGVNSTVRDRVRIAEGSLIGMAAAVLGDTEPWGVYTGNPARKGATSSKDVDF
jgi:sugar O-acyltransferase (sialic acid O-acetyltransferase NeuD family)